MSSLLNLPKSVHFIGICGTAMASVAAELHLRGVEVTGSDKAAYPPMSTFLASHGVKVFEGYDAANLSSRPELVVTGNAVSRGNPEVEALLDDGSMNFCSLPELIERSFLPGKKPLVVTGTHGKTTTTALCTWILKEAGKDPSWLIGGLPAGLEGGFKLSSGEPFVLEGDEYDTAFFDKRPKFIHYRPRVLVLNNLEYDHADIYPDIERIREVFRHLLRIVPGSGLIVANADDPEIAALIPLAPCRVETYSKEGLKADWSCLEEPGKLTVTGPEGYRAVVAHSLVGTHQPWNLMAALAACRAYGVGPEEAEKAVSTFRGVKRRAEKVGEAGGVTVFDDFAHHPTAIASTLAGFRLLYPDRRIWAVVEPRSNSMRRRVFAESLPKSFADADYVLMRQVPDPGKVPDGQLLNVDAIVASIAATGKPAEAFSDAQAIVAHLKPLARPGDVVVVLSNGGFEGIHGKLLTDLGER